MMSKQGVCIAAAVVMVLTPLIALAQPGPAFQPDGQTFAPGVSGKEGGQSGRSGLGSPSTVSRFLNLEKVTGQNALAYDFPPVNGWDDSTRLIADYYFGTGGFVPMVGLSMGYVQDDNKKEQFTAGPAIGLKYFMNPSTYLYGLLEYQLLFGDPATVSDDLENGRFFYGIGLGLTFSY